MKASPNHERAHSANPRWAQRPPSVLPRLSEFESFRQNLQNRRFDVLGRIMRPDLLEDLREALAPPDAIRAELKVIFFASRPAVAPFRPR
jgi:hypothetical protein